MSVTIAQLISSVTNVVMDVIGEELDTVDVVVTYTDNSSETFSFYVVQEE